MTGGLDEKAGPGYRGFYGDGSAVARGTINLPELEVAGRINRKHPPVPSTAPESEPVAVWPPVP